jgi:hypothetical protein
LTGSFIHLAKIESIPTEPNDPERAVEMCSHGGEREKIFKATLPYLALHPG